MTQWRVSGFDEVRELGRGAQGRVVLARHSRAGTPVAIKYLAADADARVRERFREEARMLGRVDDPHVARLYRLVETDDGIAIIMEAVDGVSFKEILARHGALAPEAALTALKGSLLGLAAAHDAGVVHRDYKPANVIVPADGRSRLVDFGVAVLAGESSAAGTPLYMAPEQWRGEGASPATDVYAATCVFFEAVTGRRPYPAEGQAALRARHLSAPVPVEEVPGPLRPLVARGMAKDPADRPAGARAFVAELDAVARAEYGPEWESRGLRVLAGAAVALAALFPLVAAGLAPAGAAVGTAGAAGASAASAASASGTSGLLAAVGTKTAVAIAGTAVVGAGVGGVGVYKAVGSEPEKRPAAVRSAAPTRTLTLGALRVKAPVAWKAHRYNTEGASYKVELPNSSCTPLGTAKDPLMVGREDECPGFEVLDEYGMGWKRERDASSYVPGRPYIPSNDPGHVCPPAQKKYAMAVPAGRKQRVAAKVGTRDAQHEEWRFECMGNDLNGHTGVFFTQRLWYIPQAKVLILDEWGMPGLDQVLRDATWL
ncbi:serine/threonine-protein kinase [Actinomadura miaoliensis]|uniref:non-specific serine/threonine protein kinase n=1 Tax=Actinomadura miaoliensis TaxID=430685 RepID=A0ABP7WVE6_9ACTN